MLNKRKPRSEFSRNFLTLMTGTTIAQAIPIAISPILTRIYTPEDFGVFALFISIVSMMAVISTAKYEMSILLPKQENFAYQLVVLSGFFVIMSSVLYLISLVFVESFLYRFDTIYYLIPATVLFIGLNNTFDKYNNRIKNYKLMSYQRIIKTTVESVISISFMFFLHLKTGLIWGFVLGFFVSSGTMLYINAKYFHAKALRVSKTKMRSLAQKYSNFPKYNMPHALLNTLSSHTPIFLIPIFYTNTTLGFYALGVKMVQAPLGLVSSALFNVLGQKMAEEHAKGNEIYSLYKQMIKKLLFVALSLIPLFLFADELFAFVFGAQWREAGEYVQIMMPILLATFVLSPLSSIPHIFQQQKKALYIEIFSTMAKIVPFLLGAYFLKLEIQSVLMFYVSLQFFIFVYGLRWSYSLVKKHSLEVGQ